MNERVKRTPKFSIIHSSARPEKWPEIHDAWIGAAERPEDVEYILCADRRWGFDATDLDLEDGGYSGIPHRFHTVWNEGRRCYVDGANTAAAASTGQVLIVIADDQYPCPHWDTELLQLLDGELDGEFVIAVPTGTPREFERQIIVMPILSRSWYAHLGHVIFDPRYESMFADNDFCEHAKRDDVLIDARDLPEFPHRHPLFRGDMQVWQEVDGQKVLVVDDAYKAQNRPEAYATGELVLTQRRAAEFGHNPNYKTVAGPAIAGARECIYLCLPGETFSMQWVHGAFTSIIALSPRYIIMPAFGHSSSVFSTRQAMIDNIKNMSWGAPGLPDAPDWIVSVDDDNVVTHEAIEVLLADLRACPEAGMALGWCWIGPGSYGPSRPSVSFLKPGTWATQPMRIEDLRAAAKKGEVLQSSFEAPIVGGFPLVAIRYSALLDLDEKPFRPAAVGLDIPNWGMVFEDISFCYRMQEAGWKVLVDPRCEVPHLKLGVISGSETTEIVPSPLPEASPAPPLPGSEPLTEKLEEEPVSKA